METAHLGVAMFPSASDPFIAKILWTGSAVSWGGSGCLCAVIEPLPVA